MFGPPQKPWLWTEKPEGTSSAIFGVGVAAKCCELKRCADRVRRRTDNKDEVLKGQLSILLNLFFPLIKLFLTFVVFGKTRDSVRFRAKNAGYSTGLSQVHATSYW